MVLKIKKIMELRKISKEEVSEKTGIKLEMISKLENGELEKINVKDMEKLCLCFDCQPSDLFEE